MGIAAQIGDHFSGTVKGRLAIDHPFFPVANIQEILIQSGELCFQKRQEFSPEFSGENSDRQEELLSGTPPVSRFCQSAAGYNHMDMGMELEILPPGMQYGGYTGSRSQIFPVCAQFQHNGGRGLKQQVVHGVLLAPENRIQLSRNRENSMEIGNIQQILPLFIDPFLFRKGLAFGTVPVPAGIVRNPCVPTGITGIHMRTQGRSPAGNDVFRRFPLRRTHQMLLSISRQMSGKNILNLNTHCS